MEEFDNAIVEFETVWAHAYEQALNNPSSREQYVNESSLSALNESSAVVINWFKRLRAPAGFSPGFHIAKSVCSIYFPQLIASAKQISSGQFNHFGNFSAYLTNVLNAIHTMAVFQAKDGETLPTDLSAELIQSIELINTAQRELSGKLELIQDASVKYHEIDTFISDLEEKRELTTALLNQVDNTIQTLNQKNSSLDQLIEQVDSQKSNFDRTIKSHEEEYIEAEASRVRRHSELIANLADENSELTKQNQLLQEQLVTKATQLDELIEKAQAQNKVIDSILPKAASAGLAEAFSKRVSQLDKTKWMWLILFVVSLVLLYFFAKGLSLHKISTMDEFVSKIVYKLPLSAPLIWLAWFSAIQYGNNIRVQEDYAFKEATSKAFQGYKDHMEHLGNIDLNEAETAMTLLSASTIRILGNEPIRIYGKSHSDASPTYNLADLLRSIGNKKSSE